MCFCFHVMFACPPTSHLNSLTGLRRIVFSANNCCSPDGKQDLSDSAGGIGGALVSTTHNTTITGSSNNNNNNNNNCNDNDDNDDDIGITATAPAVVNGKTTQAGGSSDASGGATASGSGDQQPPQPTTPKWPVKPGVHLHVNGLHSLGKSVKPINGFSYGTKPSSSTLPLPNSNGKIYFRQQQHQTVHSHHCGKEISSLISFFPSV